MIRDLPPSPMTTDRECYVFGGWHIDPFIAYSEREAQVHARYLDSDNQQYAVVRFNAVEGRSRDVTDDFRPQADEPEEPEYTAASHIAWMRMAGAYR